MVTQQDLDARLKRAPRPRDPAFDLASKLKYWVGHFYGVYAGRPDPSAGVSDAQSDLGSRLIRSALARIQGNLAKSGRQPLAYEPLPEIDGDCVTDEAIQELTRYQVPFVVRGGIKDWPAVREFTPDFFLERYGDVKIPVNKGEKRPSADKSKPTDYRQYYKIRYDSVRNLVESVKNGGNLQALSVEDLLHRDDDYLIKNFLRLDRVQRWSGYSSPSRNFLDRKLRTGLVGSLQLFMASTAGYTTWHCAPAHNFFLQLYGRKYWTFIDTAYTVAMSPVIKRSQQYQGSLIDAREPFEDCVARGFKLYPYVPKFDVTLEPGDLLFNPQYCWHSVRTAGDQPTIGIGIRTVAEQTLRSPAYQLLRMLDWESYRIIKASANQGRLKDDDLVNRIFEYVDPENRLDSREHVS